MIDWDELRYLLAVRRAGSLNAAARALGVDKTTVSRRIAALEDTLGVRLFDRKPDGYRLTPHGERAIAAVAEIEGTVSALVAELSEVRGDRNGVVRLTVPQFFASQILLPALPAFRASHPRIDLVVNASSTVVNVAQREAEVGLRNVKPDQLSVTVKRVGMLGMALYASRTYLSRRGTPSVANDMAQHDLIGWESAFTHAKGFLWANNCGARSPIRLNDSAVMCDAVAADLGIAALPCLLGDERAKLVRLDGFGLSRDPIYAVAPGELRHSGRVRAVIDLIVAAWSTNTDRLAGGGKRRKPS
ncbi:MAG TPA: LysR family transcriptional regulator [Polyangia bacterium]|jgi:DNA-binding transcriptional LysR family regulator|nr:LysR family transcriptional regulator [Polyangia bacterium]